VTAAHLLAHPPAGGGEVDVFVLAVLNQSAIIKVDPLPTFLAVF
jgi:hypothetical protein